MSDIDAEQEAQEIKDLRWKALKVSPTVRLLIFPALVAVIAAGGLRMAEPDGDIWPYLLWGLVLLGCAVGTLFILIWTPHYLRQLSRDELISYIKSPSWCPW